MSDMVNAGAGPLTFTINGKDVVFSLLNFHDRTAMLKAQRRVDRDQLKVRLGEAGVIDPPQTYSELDRFDNEVIGSRMWSLFFNSDDGKMAILARSVDKTQPGTGTAIAEQLDWDEEKVLNVAAYVARVTLLDNKGAEKQNPLAPTPPVTTLPPAYGR